MSSKGTSQKKKPHWGLRWSWVILMALYFCAAWATHGNYAATRVLVRIAPYLGVLYFGITCVCVVLLFGKDHPVQTALAVAAIALFGASYVVEGWLALAGSALAVVLAVTSAHRPIRKMFADLRDSYRRISATTKQP